MLKLRKSWLWRWFGYLILISIDFYNFILHFLLTFGRLRRYIKHSRQCFVGYSNTSNFIKNTLLRVVFSTLLGVWISRWNTVACVWYITFSVLCNHLISRTNGWLAAMMPDKSTENRAQLYGGSKPRVAGYCFSDTGTTLTPSYY